MAGEDYVEGSQRKIDKYIEKSLEINQAGREAKHAKQQSAKQKMGCEGRPAQGYDINGEYV